MASGHEVVSGAILIGKRWLLFGKDAGRVTKGCANRYIRFVLPPDIGGRRSDTQTMTEKLETLSWQATWQPPDLG